MMRGWLTSSGRYYQSALYPTRRHLDRHLVRWAMATDKRLRRQRRRAEPWLRRVARRAPRLFAHWPMLHQATAGQ